MYPTKPTIIIQKFLMKVWRANPATYALVERSINRGHDHGYRSRTLLLSLREVIALKALFGNFFVGNDR